jgi:hypothetical protein
MRRWFFFGSVGLTGLSLQETGPLDDKSSNPVNAPGPGFLPMLQVLVLAPGRSGTTSLQALIEGLCRANGCDWTVQHQTEQGPLTEAAADSILRGDESRAREVLAGWRHQVEVSGNQNAFLVPVFREVFGDGLKVIRLRREPEAHLKSFLTGPRVSPEVWGGYHDSTSDYQGPIYWQPPTAPWFGQMSAGEWDRLPSEERVRWYLETLQTWMDRGAESFERRLDLRTEELDEPDAIDRLATFLNPAWAERVEPVRQNCRRMFDYSKLTVAQAREARRVWARFDFNRALNDPTYLLSWAIDKTLDVADDRHRFLCDLERLVRDLRVGEQGAPEGPLASPRVGR